MVVMMMVMMPGAASGVNVAMLIVTLLALRFNFKGYMGNAVLLQFLTHKLLYIMTVTPYDNVHGCVIIMSVKTPYVYMMNIGNALDLAKVELDFLQINSRRKLFKENIRNFLKAFKSAYENK